MRFNIGLDELSLRLQFDINYYRIQHQPIWLNRELSLDEARDICFLVLQRIVHESMLWREKEKQSALELLDALFTRAYPGYAHIDDSPEDDHCVADDFYCTVLDRLYLSLCDIVGGFNVDGCRTWNILSIRRNDGVVSRTETVTVMDVETKIEYQDLVVHKDIISAGAVIVNEGDYRIMDWTRRMKSGEWGSSRTKSAPAPAENKQTSTDFEDVNKSVLAQHRRNSGMLGISTFGKKRLAQRQ